ncbi:MAG: PIN/TRAM domain-containing protein [Candidatus Bipolaricaulia bacterium]
MLRFLLYISLFSLGGYASIRENALPDTLSLNGNEHVVNFIIGGVAGVIVAWALIQATAIVEKRVEEGEIRELINGSLTAILGIALGLIVYTVLELIFPSHSLLQWIEAVIVLFLGFLGFRIGYQEQNPMVEIFSTGRKRSTGAGSIKILDTSVIIDGRIADLVETGFVEGTLIIPQFVLNELHNIADSSDDLRRRKGRRGLDILSDLRKSDHIDIETVETDYPDIETVDRKLIRLTQELNGKLLTTDYNLNKVARIEGIHVLNINRLANAVKPEFLPGDTVVVEVIDRGEEIGQGVGYLDNGTMVVVENGRRFIGKKIKTVVKSSLQTDAGKMLFVQPEGENQKRWENN